MKTKLTTTMMMLGLAVTLGASIAKADPDFNTEQKRLADAYQTQLCVQTPGCMNARSVENIKNAIERKKAFLAGYCVGTRGSANVTTRDFEPQRAQVDCEKDHNYQKIQKQIVILESQLPAAGDS